MARVLRHSLVALLTGMLLFSMANARTADQYRRWLDDDKTCSCTDGAVTVAVTVNPRNTAATTAVTFSKLDQALVANVPTLDGLGLALLVLCVAVIGLVVARLRRT